MTDSRLVDQVLNIIAEEVGVDREELCDDTELEDLGVDTILARTIAKHIANTTKLDIDASILQDGASVGGLKQHIAEAARSQHPISQKPQPPTQTPPKQNGKPNNTVQSTQPLALRLQGNANAPRKVFLLPDGSGMGMAYAQIPPLGPDICLYGLNSPLLHASSLFTGTIEDLAQIWASEIQKIQPHGPYILGGWSAGGYHSYEVTKQLIRVGERVEKLVLIDSPCRLVFEALPMEVVHYLASNNLMGNWGSRKTPEWLVRHFDSTIAAVEKYVPTALECPAAQMPEVYLIWAEDVVLAKGQAKHTGLDLSVKVSRFLLEERPNFGPHGWDRLFPGKEVVIATMPGHHFEVVHPPSVKSLGNLLKDVLRNHSWERESEWRKYESR
ncbi:alpha/beta-hydrolase [Hypomontagnella monticulosa]|nr:alpha/beta-hydrolase [Hypomontagnella monticulosa]